MNLENARIAFKNENYDNPKYYDVDYDYYNDEEIQKLEPYERNSGSDYGIVISLEQRFLMLQKKENKIKFNEETIVKRKKLKCNELQKNKLVRT